MNYLKSRHMPAIEECFENWGESLSHPTETQWDITSRNNGSDLSLHASLIEDWLQIHADIGAAAGNSQIRSALKWNGDLDGTAKFFLGSAGHSIGIRAEIPLDSEAGIRPDLIATLAGLKQAVGQFHNSSGQEPDPKIKSAYAESAPESTLPLPELLAETDWVFTERAEDSCMVDLDVRGDFRQALIETGPDGSRRASVELASWETHTPASLNALAVLLLTASGVIRMVRPVIEDSGERITARFEICFSPDVNAALLDRGLSSLSIACRLCGREAVVLNNPRIAEEYLAIRHLTNSQ